MRPGAVPPDPSWSALRVHTGRLVRRARRRIWVVLGLAALSTLGTLFLAARRPIRQTAIVVLRMTEDVKAPLRLTWTDKAIRGYVSEVALSQTALLGLIDRHRLFRNQPGKFDPIAAVDTLRERIEVEVVQNHAIALVARDNRPRSAHVRINYQDGDPARALVIARELGELVVATGRNQQHALAEAAAKEATAEAEDARRALETLRRQATSSSLAPYGARSWGDVPGMADAFRLGRARLDRAEESVERAEQRLRGDFDESTLYVELLETVPAPAPWPVTTKLSVVGTAASLLCFPLAALMVGAWDPRIYSVEDLLHLGVRCLGHFGVEEET
jgi:hypothetical protein